MLLLVTYAGISSQPAILFFMSIYNISHFFMGDIWYENTVCNTIHVKHVVGSGRYVAGYFGPIDTHKNFFY